LIVLVGVDAPFLVSYLTTGVRSALDCTRVGAPSMQSASSACSDQEEIRRTAVGQPGWLSPRREFGRGTPALKPLDFLASFCQIRNCPPNRGKSRLCSAMAAVHHAFHRRMARCRIALPALVNNNESASPSFTRNLFGLHPAHGSQMHHGSPRYRSRAHHRFGQTKTRAAVRAHRSRVYPRSALKMRKPGKPGFHAQFSPSHFAGYHNAGIFSRIIVME
jgi:hypothetical protein